jgi:hypothetical protein
LGQAVDGNAAQRLIPDALDREDKFDVREAGLFGGFDSQISLAEVEGLFGVIGPHVRPEKEQVSIRIAKHYFHGARFINGFGRRSGSTGYTATLYRFLLPSLPNASFGSQSLNQSKSKERRLVPATAPKESGYLNPMNEVYCMRDFEFNRGAT